MIGDIDVSSDAEEPAASVATERPAFSDRREGPDYVNVSFCKPNLAHLEIFPQVIPIATQARLMPSLTVGDSLEVVAMATRLA